MLSHLRGDTDVSTRCEGAVPRQEAGVRASCPFPGLQLAGGAGTCTVTTAWSRVGRTVRRRMRSRGSGRHRTGKSRPRKDATGGLCGALRIGWNGTTGTRHPAAIRRRREQPEG